jgi:hypothetical protein
MLQYYPFLLLIFVKTDKYSLFWVFGKVLILFLNKKAAGLSAA